jgi:hypothetical protein
MITKRKKQNSVLCVLAVVVVLIITVIHKKVQTVQSIDTTLIENFDIILTKGESNLSRVVLFLNPNKHEYSHIGILQKVGNRVFVLHATPNNNNESCIRYDDFKTFLALSSVSKYVIIRSKKLTSPCKERLKIEVEKWKSKNHPFDFEFNNLDNSKVYCSELVWLIYSKAGLLKVSAFDLSKPIYPSYFIKMGVSFTSVRQNI